MNNSRSVDTVSFCMEDIPPCSFGVISWRRCLDKHSQRRKARRPVGCISGDDVLDKCSQRRRRVTRLAHAEGEQREAGSVGKLDS
jgi:hypothetical protein